MKMKLLAIAALVLCLAGCDPVQIGYNLLKSPPPCSGRVSFSPNGKHLVFGITEGGDSGGGIYRMDTDWKNPIKLTTNKPPICDAYPVYSPDGSKIVFTRLPNCNDAEPAHLFIMNADGTNSIQLTDGPYLDTAPVFLPEGDRIYFLRSAFDRNGRSPNGYEAAIYSIKTDGSDYTKIPVNYKQTGEPALSPDGKNLIFTVNSEREQRKFHVFSLETQQEINSLEPYFKGLPEGKKYEIHIEQPTFSLDGKFILFSSSRYAVNPQSWAHTAIYRYDLEINTAEEIANVSSFGEEWPSISLDGQTIVFLEYTGSLGHIVKSFWSVKFNGTDLKKIYLDL